jgi:hypothetical protein
LFLRLVETMPGLRHKANKYTEFSTAGTFANNVALILLFSFAVFLGEFFFLDFKSSNVLLETDMRVTTRLG